LSGRQGDVLALKRLTSKDEDHEDKTYQQKYADSNEADKG